MSIQRDLQRLIVEELTEDRTEIDPDVSLIAAGILDSIAIIRVFAFIEENYGITINDPEKTLDNFETIDRISAFIERKREVIHG